MKEPENHTSTDCSLAQNSEDCFAVGVNPDDITPFWNLNSRLPLLNAFITLFSGSDIYVVLRLLVLMEMVSKVDPPMWGMAELRHNFGYLSETAFETVTKRLRDGGLIDYRRDTNSYSVTSLGQKAQGAVSVFLKNEGDEGVGMLTSLIYAGEVTGTLGREELEHLLYRLNQLEYEITDAIESASENTIIEARRKFESIWRYIEKGTEIIKRLTQDAETDRPTHRLAQQIGHAQSRLAKKTSVFQKALNDIDRQRVHLGNSGVSTSDLGRYLMGRSVSELLGLLSGTVGVTVKPVFVLSDIIADVAEYELIEKERTRYEEWRLPEAEDSPVQEDVFTDCFVHLKGLHEDLSAIESEAAFSAVIPRANFEESSYRFSMIALMGGNVEGREGEVADILGLPLIARFEEGEEEVLTHGVKTISKGVITRTDGRHE
ncbi:MAG: hypothetical protein WA666_07605 [Nitrospirota bacterium]